MVGALTIPTQTNTFFSMKKILFLSMGLLAAMAFSPQPAFSAPDTGPKVDNIEVIDNSSAEVPAGTNDIAFMAVGNEASNTNITFINTSGRETLVHRSDHTVGTNHYVLNPFLEEMTVVPSMTVSSALAVDDRQRSCNSMIMNGTVNLDPIKNSAGLPFVGAAQHSRQLVWVMKRPGWTVRYLRC